MNNLAHHTEKLVHEKLVHMNKERLRQYQEENDAWKRLLVFLQAENNYLKIRLAYLVSQEISQKFLARAENLQNELIQKDELIALNRSAVSGFEKYLMGQIPENRAGNKDVNKRHEKLRSQVELLEHKFSRHSSEFNDHLIENL